MPARFEEIVALPKAELHIHIEGSLEPEMVFSIARRSGVALEYSTVEQLRQAYRFSNLQDFLNIYYQGMSVLLNEQDFYDMAWAYLGRAHTENVVRTEIFFDPQGHTDRGVSFDTVIGGLHRATVDAKAQFGIDAQLIMCFLRHLDEASAERALEQAMAHREKIIGVGLDSSEQGHPPSKFKNVFRRARSAGLKLVAHAGEEGPPEYVWEALDVLGVDRIDHGNRAMEDPALVDRIARDRIPLTLCPLSNLKLCVIYDIRMHPLKRMMDRGLRVTVNSDDPAYFGGYISQNYLAVTNALGLSEAECAVLAHNSLEAAFD